MQTFQSRRRKHVQFLLSAVFSVLETLMDHELMGRESLILWEKRGWKRSNLLARAETFRTQTYKVTETDRVVYLNYPWEISK